MLSFFEFEFWVALYLYFHLFGSLIVGMFEVFILDEKKYASKTKVLFNFLKNLIITPIPAIIKIYRKCKQNEIKRNKYRLERSKAKEELTDIIINSIKEYKPKFDYTLSEDDIIDVLFSIQQQFDKK